MVLTLEYSVNSRVQHVLSIHFMKKEMTARIHTVFNQDLVRLHTVLESRE